MQVELKLLFVFLWYCTLGKLCHLTWLDVCVVCHSSSGHVMWVSELCTGEGEGEWSLLCVIVCSVCVCVCARSVSITWCFWTRTCHVRGFQRHIWDRTEAERRTPDLAHRLYMYVAYLIHATSSFCCLCPAECPHSRRKTAWAINTELSTHTDYSILYGRRSECMTSKGHVVIKCQVCCCWRGSACR